MTRLCGEAEMNHLVQALQSGEGSEIEAADRLIGEFPGDPRLHFLRGSILASIGRPIEAMPALRKAVELAPDFAIARFQLGFFQLTSGEALNALSTWGPLAMLPEENYLRKFVAGLTHLIRDEFAEAVEQLRQGILANEENAPLNRDMQLLIDQASELQSRIRPDHQRETESMTSFLLNQASDSRRAH
jgi:tetratricopeptide (TPR) repeat protein